jgi:hypothetical protein
MLYFGVGLSNADKIYVPIIHVNDITPHIILCSSTVASTEEIPFPIQCLYPMHRALVHFRTLP